MLKVVSVAYEHDGMIYSIPAPARHHNILWKIGRQLPPRNSGFLLSDGSFADRAFAYRVAENAGQIKPRDSSGYNGPDLYSEDVW
jgi:hypothetical protein